MRVLSSATALAILMASALIAQEGDPFAVKPSSEDEAGTKKGETDTYETTGFYEVASSAGYDPEKVSAVDWPRIEDPVTFNRNFDRPDQIWRVDGGYFGAFDGGEWGGALFYAADKDPKWTRIIETHIQDLERFEGDTFLATGGLAHLSLTTGTAYLITRKPTGEWMARKVFHSETGIPRVVGISKTGRFGDKDSKKLVVLSPGNFAGPRFLLGVDSSGTIYYLGERKKVTPDIQAPQAGPAPADGGKEQK